MKIRFNNTNIQKVILIFYILFLWVIAETGNTLTIQTIYISQQDGSDIDNNGTDINLPIRTLARARIVALSNWRNVDGFEILLKGGEQFDKFLPITNQVLKDYDPERNTFAFVWDIDRSLKISTYGPQEKANLYSGKYTHEGGPQAAIAITTPSTKNVTIENIHFIRWQVSAFFAYKTKNIQFLNNIVEEIGTLYFPDETTPGIYGAGAIYPKNSSDVLIKGNYIRNIHNQFDMLDKMHVFYMTRLSNSELCDNIVINASGPPLKFRRSQTNHVYVHDNEFYYTGPSTSLNQVQEGWVRYSGDSDDGCPYALVIENNLFYYPFCWENTQDCDQAIAAKYSISNTSVCGSDACEDDEKVKWIDNEYRFQWQPFIVPPLPTKISESTTKTVSGFRLYENFPNPFKQITNIHYEIVQPDNINIQVFDILGRYVKTLYKGYHDKGSYTVNWNGYDEKNQIVPNGIYVCVFLNGETTDLVKMVYLR